MDKIEIDKWCMESYPCKHAVKINGQDKGLWNGIAIKQWLINHGHAVPEHFQEYKNV